MKIAVWFLAALFAYFFTGVNLSILLSKAVYHEDIRTKGSKNPGFTNFKRVYGGKLPWVIFVFDLVKAAIPALVGGLLFSRFLSFDGAFQVGAAFAGLFGVIGNSFPVYYSFQGGKGFLACLSCLFFLDWRAGLAAFGVLTLLLFTLKWMSVSTLSSLVAGAALLPVFGVHGFACLFYAASVLWVIARHHKNIARLFAGQEPKFSFGRKKEEKN